MTDPPRIDSRHLQHVFDTFTLDRLLRAGEVTEIQSKILIDEQTHHRLHELFSSVWGAPTRGLLIQTRYRDKPGGSGDLRLRLWYNPQTIEPDGAEVILKQDKPGEGINADSRLEIKDHPSLKLLAFLRKALDTDLRLYHDPHWLKLKDDYHASIKGTTYRVSLQYLAGIHAPFGYVIEASIKLPGIITKDVEQSHKHHILSLLGTYDLHEDKQGFQAHTDAFIEANKNPQ